MSEGVLTYATAIARLEEIVARLEQGQVSVDELAAAVKEGVKLVSFCRERLGAVKAEVDSALQDLDTGGAAGQSTITDDPFADG